MQSGSRKVDRLQPTANSKKNPEKQFGRCAQPSRFVSRDEHGRGAKRARCIVPLRAAGIRRAIVTIPASLRRFLRGEFDGAVVNPEKKSCGKADGADGPPGALGVVG